MTKQFKLSAAHDLVFERGNLVLWDSTAQRVKTRLLMLLGEWFLDTIDGTPYLQQILIKNPNLENVRAAIRDRIINTEGVRSIANLELDYDTVRRELSVTAGIIGAQGLFTVTV
jgi:hypothetical protein